MKKSNFTATYKGQCYIKGYGKRLYKKGVELTNIKDDDILSLCLC